MVHALGGSCLPRGRGCPHLSVRRSSSPASTCPITTAQFGGAVSRLKHRGSALVVSAGVRAPARASVETPRRAGSSEYSSIARFFVKTFYLDEDPSALLPGPCRALERDQAQDWSARYSGRGLQGAVFTTRVGRDLGATVSLGVTPFKGNQALQRLSDLSAPPEGSKLRPVIANLAVAKAFRRRGLAKALVRRCEEQVEGWGFDEVMLIVNARNNRARSLYRKLGYRVVGGQQGEEYVVREGEVQKAKVRNVVMRRSLKPGLAGFLDNLDWLTVVLVALGLSFLSQADKIPLESLSGLDLTSFDVRSYRQ